MMCNLYRTIYEIGNQRIRNRITADFAEYTTSGKTMSDFFKVSILVAKRYNGSFILESKKLEHPELLIIFGDRNGYFIDTDYTKLQASAPVEIQFDSLLRMLDIKQFNLHDEYFNRVNIYKIKCVKDKRGNEILQGVRHYTVPGLSNAELNIAVDVWPPQTIYWLPSRNLFQNQHFCETEKCGYRASRSDNLKRHEKNCTNIQKVTPKQELYGRKNDVITKLKNISNFDLERQTHMLVYDIETFNNGEILVPVSIATATTLDEPKYFQRIDDDPESGYRLVKEFMEYLLKLQKELVKKQKHIGEKASYIEKKYQKGTISKTEARHLVNYLYTYNTLKCFAFNGRKVLKFSNSVNFTVRVKTCTNRVTSV